VHHDADPYAYHFPHVVNYLDGVQTKSKVYAKAKGRPPQHAFFKDKRATVSGSMQIIYPFKWHISDHPHIEGMAQGLRKTAPNLPKYSGTVPIDPLLNKYVGWYKTSDRWQSMDEKKLRELVVVLPSIKLGARAMDISKVSRD
jgi:hypothetical protein